jgi:nucleoside transporter
MDDHNAPDVAIPAAPMEPPGYAPEPSVLYVRLSVMMFLQFAVWGGWAVMIFGHMQNNLHFTGLQIGLVFGTTAFGALVSPIVAGWLADRLMPSQRFAAICHFVGAIPLFIAWTQNSFWGLWGCILAHAVLYMPTIALTNTVAFYHMGQSTKFGNIRVWGTIGWICIQFLLGWYVGENVARARDCLLFGGVAGMLMAVYCLTLPNTPPSKESKNPYAFLEALKLVADRNFAVLLIISFIVGIELPFYYNLTFGFFTDPVTGVGLSPGHAQWAQVLGQVGEVLLMVLLWPSIRRLGMGWTIFIGILGWPLRYGIFALGHPTWLVIAAQSLHGVCYSFFFVGGMIAVERLSHKDIRASAQSLLVFATSGLGMLIGHFGSGTIHDYFKLTEDPGSWAWPKIFMVPIVLTVVAAIAFIALFNERRFQERAKEIEAEDAGAAPEEAAAEAPA